jgi:hypothetical protein
MQRFLSVLGAQPAPAASSDARRAKKKMKRAAKNFARAHKEMQVDLDSFHATAAPELVSILYVPLHSTRILLTV